jgi:hypothetical protein
MATTRKGRIIPPPDPPQGGVFAPDPTAIPAFRGEGEGKGDVSVECGTPSCGTLLVQDMLPGRIRGIAIICPKCGGYNLINI